MRKIKRFNLSKNHFLSSEEMIMLNGGGEYLHDSCDQSNVGQSCLYGGAGSHYTGTCTYIHNHSSTGSTSSTTSGYFCVKNQTILGLRLCSIVYSTL